MEVMLARGVARRPELLSSAGLGRQAIFVIRFAAYLFYPLLTAFT
jgi:hypothetical protein